MSQPTTADSNTLIKDIGMALIKVAPPDWQQIRTEFRATGRYYELTAEVVDADGTTSAWTASHEIALMFARLRAAMHPIEGGTWFNARYQIERPSKYNVEFDRNEPRWRSQPPVQAFRDELRYFPREEADVPDWLMLRMSGLTESSGEHRFRVARVFDAKGPRGRPTVNRPPVPEHEREQLRKYLDRARLVLPVRGNDVDHLSSDGQRTVPIAFHSDGEWVWPAAVNYYFARYGLPPEPGLVEHARSQDFAVPEVDEATADAAARHITGNRPAGPPVRQGASPPPGPPPPNPDLAARVRARLDEAGVPAERYRIGEFVPGTWHLLRTPDGWLVARPDPSNPSPTRFTEEQDAAAFLLGQLLLEQRSASAKAEPRPTGEPAAGAASPIAERLSADLAGSGVASAAEPELDQAAEPRHAVHESETADPVEPVQEDGAGKHEATERDEPEAVPDETPSELWKRWRISDDPPGELFREKRRLTLPAGTEVDRYGQPEGGLVYAAGTPFEQRSLPADWAERDLLTYRLTKELTVLGGTAIAWFEQPGGGTGYLLPDSIGELLKQGVLEAVDTEPAAKEQSEEPAEQAQEPEEDAEAEAAESESTETESTKAESTRAEPTDSEPVEAEAVEAQPVESGARSADTDSEETAAENSETGKDREEASAE